MATALLKKLVHASTQRSLWNGSVKFSKFDQCPALNRSREHFRDSRRVQSPFRMSTLENRNSPARATFRKFGLLEWYLNCLKTRPIVTKSITSSLIYAAADASSQKLFGGDEYDMARTTRMAGYGMLILGPSLHYWYNYMSRIFPRCDLSSTLRKMALGQTTYGPAMTAIFFTVNAALRGETAGEIASRLKRDLLPTLINGAMYWPVCDFLTFKYIPVHLQPLAVNSFAYLWTIYMTYMAGQEKAGEEEEEGCAAVAAYAS